MSASFLGVDLGTSGLKLTLVSEEGHVVGESEAPYAVQTPQPGFAETDPDVWMEALRQAVTRLTAEPGEGSKLEAIGFTGQMHGIVLTSEDGRPVRPAVLWPDQRATSVLPDWFTMAREDRAALANPVFAGMAGPMLTWFSQNEPEVLVSADLMRSPKDWLRSQLTGDRVTERSDASATLLWDVTADDWSTAAAAVAGVRVDQLPDVGDSDAVVGKAPWPPAAGDQAPELPSVTVVAGGADTACALSALRAGLATTWPDTVVVNVGTGVQIVRPGVTPMPRDSPVTHLYADADGGWYEMLAVQNGGLALSWCQEILALDWDSFVAAAATARAGSEGLSFVPFLAGERGGVAGPGARAGWLGGSSATGRAELARSAFEALAFTIRRGIELLGVGESTNVVVSGGGAREPWVRQLVADTLGRPLSYVSLRSASGVGAAVLAARAVGVDLSVAAEVVEVTSSPSAVLDDAYRRWLRAVQAMAAYAE